MVPNLNLPTKPKPIIITMPTMPIALAMPTTVPVVPTTPTMPITPKQLEPISKHLPTEFYHHQNIFYNHQTLSLSKEQS